MQPIFKAIFLLFALSVGASSIAADRSVNVGGTMMGDGGYGGYGTIDPILMFSPAQISVNVGDTVTFTNQGGAAHNVHADDNSFRCANGCDGDGAGGNGTPSAALWSASVKFTKAGVVNYHCDTHVGMGMSGSIVVNAATTPSINLGGYMSGNWYNAAQGGHGFQLEFTNRSTGTTTADMVAIWFVYSPAGSTANDGSGQNWIYAEGDYDTTKNTVTLPAILLSGARFPPNFNPNDVTRVPGGATWGTMTFTFSDCNNGTVSWISTAPGYPSSTTPLAITRLTQIAGTTCPQ